MDKSKRAIIDAALSLFVTKGYHSTSIQSIAKEAGIAIGLMYHYFKSKEEMLIYLMQEHIDEIQRTIGLELAKTTDSENIRVVIDVLLAAVIRMSDSWRLIITVLFQPDVASSAKEMISKLAEHQNELYVSYFRKAGMEKPEETANTLSVVIHGALLAYALTGSLEELQIIRRNVIENIIQKGIA